MENSAEQGGGRRNPDGFRGRQRSYAEFYTTDVKGFYLRIVLLCQYGLQIRRQRRAEKDSFSRDRMVKTHFAAMQRLPRDAVKRAAVEVVAEQRMSQMRHMAANLVRPAGF